MIKCFHQAFRLDISTNSDRLSIYIKSSLPNFYLTIHSHPVFQAIPFVLNLKKRKWLFISIYRPPSQKSQCILNSISDMLDYYSSHYEYKVIFGDFNLNPVKPEMSTFLKAENLTNLIKENTCLKGQVHVLM